MAAQHNIAQLFPSDEVEYIKNVRLQVDVFRKEMRPFANTRQRRREYLMTLLLQCSTHTSPAPTTVPGTMNQNERTHDCAPNFSDPAFADRQSVISLCNIFIDP
jgi:hypothetical protein